MRSAVLFLVSLVAVCILFHVKIDGKVLGPYVVDFTSGEDRISIRLVPLPDLDQGQKSDNDIVSAKSYTPVVFWHEMGSTGVSGTNQFGMQRVYRDWLALQRAYPGMKVFSVQGASSSVHDDYRDFSNVNKQTEQACRSIITNEEIKASGAINSIGFGLSALFMRALIQRCPLRENGIRVKNFISLGGPHQGIFGIANCTSEYDINICNVWRDGKSQYIYEYSTIDDLKAQYWHDPTQEYVYKKAKLLLPDINNENTLNQTYKDNLLALENLVLVLFQQDEMIVPRESSLFAFHEPGQKSTIRPLEKSPLYLEDRLGLKQLNESGRLKMISIPGKHLEYEMTWFLERIAAKYLDN